MEMTITARTVLEKLLDECENNSYMVFEAHENEGICYECGEIVDGVEPDATAYECPCCGESTVCGIENALFGIT